MKYRFKLGIVASIVTFQITSLLYPAVSQAANLTAAKNTLQSSRMSFYGRVDATPGKTVAGSSHVWIYTTGLGNAFSISTAGLKPGDSLVIGGTDSYTISTIVDNDEFTLTSTLSGSAANDLATIYYKAKPQHVITFTTASAVNGGFFRVLVPAATSGGNDSIPDVTGFDFNNISTAGIIGTDATGFDFETVADASVATESGMPGCTSPANFHCFEFHYTGTGGVGTPITLSIGNVGSTDNIIAPAPSSSRLADTAETYTFKIQQFPDSVNPNTATPTDDVSGKVALIEPVRVTATVDPSITFKIEGVNTSTSVCGLTTQVTTTGTAVPFGILTLDTFKIAAQKLTVSTNAVSGYAVTAINNQPMSNLAAVPSYIIGTACDTGACTNTVSAAWATAGAHPGLGYTVAVANGTPTVSPASPNYQRFPNAAASEPPFQIMGNAGIASLQAAHVCYKIAVDSAQPAGNYENQVIYTATATF